MKTSPARHGFYTPLRYPGGKGKLAPYILRVLELNDLVGGTYVEPYAGGAAVAMELVLTGMVKRVHINDLDPAVHAFWKCVLDDTDALTAKIMDCQVSVENWRRMKDIQKDANADRLDLAFSTFFLNRTNRSGILNAGVIGGLQQDGPWKIDARFNKVDLTQRIEQIAMMSSRIHLHNEDAEKLVRRLARSVSDRNLFYLDPPYFVKGRDLYMSYYDPDDHASVSKTVNALPENINWVVSYDFHHRIAELYQESRSLAYTLSYSAAARQKGAELMFFSPGLIAPAPIRPMHPLSPAPAAAAGHI